MQKITLNMRYLIGGLVLSVISKILQWNNFATAGNMIVIGAAILLILALLHSLPGFKLLNTKSETQLLAKKIAWAACGAIASFQLMLIFLLQANLIGIVFIFSLLSSLLWLGMLILPLYRNK